MKDIVTMSLDLFLQSKICEMCGHEEITEVMNITYNLAPMWFLIFPEDKQMIDIDGQTGEESLRKLSYASILLKREKEFLLPLNPKNGWGSYEGLCEYITNLIDLANKNPTYIWKSWR
jgi:hypothetical protein